MADTQDPPKKTKAKKQPKAKAVREDGDFDKERLLTYLYRDERMESLADSATGYIDGHLSFDELVAKVPKTTNWLRSSLSQLERVRDNKNVLLVVGFCPLRRASQHGCRPKKKLLDYAVGTMS